MAESRFEYSDDIFESTRMSFPDHLEDLRNHLLKAIRAFLFWMVGSFFLGSTVLNFITRPVEDALVNYHYEYYKNNPDKTHKLVTKFKEGLLAIEGKVDTSKAKIESCQEKLLAAQKAEDSLATATAQDELKLAEKELDDYLKKEEIRSLYILSEPVSIKTTESALDLDADLRRLYPSLMEKTPPPAEHETVNRNFTIKPLVFLDKFQALIALASKRVTMTSLSPQEAFVVYFKVCILIGLVLSSPWVFYYIWAFIAAGLYPHEKRLVNVYLPVSVLLFLFGVFLTELFIIPAALDALLRFNLWLNVEPDFRLNEWLSFAIIMPVVTGVCFQAPLVMFVLAQLGIFNVDHFVATRKIAYFIMVIVVAVITPAVDMFSLLLIWIPMCLMYELGILMIRYYLPKEEPVEETPFDPADLFMFSEDDAEARKNGQQK